jgi:hypothetical protein
MVGLITYLLALKDLGFPFTAALAPHDVESYSLEL